MLGNIKLDYSAKAPLSSQIALWIGKQIDNGKIEKNYVLPSINQFSKEYAVARDTIERAYKEMKQMGYITSIKGRGYYVLGKRKSVLRVLLVFNKMSSYKKIVYYSFLKTLGNKAEVDFQIHHYNLKLLKNIITDSYGKYDFYVIMPHFETGIDKAEYLKVLKQIPEHQLLLLDKSVPDLKECMSVYQDFKSDIYSALTSASDIFAKYTGVGLIFPEQSNHPTEIIDGIKQFCKAQAKKFKIITTATTLKPQKEYVYIAVTEEDLGKLIKKIRSTDLKLGKDVGIISFNETELKELLDITVVSTDFEHMGQTAANMILKKNFSQVKNPFTIIKRGSV